MPNILILILGVILGCIIRYYTENVTRKHPRCTECGNKMGVLFGEASISASFVHYQCDNCGHRIKERL